MNRRDFLKLTGIAGVAALCPTIPIHVYTLDAGSTTVVDGEIISANYITTINGMVMKLEILDLSNGSVINQYYRMG